VSLVLCAATVALWVRSAWRWDHLARHQVESGRDRVCAWGSNRGRMSLNWGATRSWMPDSVMWVRASGPPRDITVTPWQRWVCEYQTTVDGTDIIRYVAVHDAWLIAITAALPVCWLLAAGRRHHRVAAGLCPA
jgi:hypothetical protein